MPIVPYDRQSAVAYAHRWAFARNPRYYNFDDFGGDCTNYASQALYAGCGIMNYASNDRGWFYISLNRRAPAWTGVEELHRLLLVAAHTYDTDYRPLSTYPYAAVRFLHILGIRKA